MGRVRPPAVAGTFYPADPQQLAGAVADLLQGAAPAPLQVVPRAVVVPHAGYAYSGPVAATSYKVVGGLDPPPQRYVLLGPSHFVRFAGIATPVADEWQNPLGSVAVDAALREHAEEDELVASDDGPHAGEHSLEVQVPFLQTLGASAVLPMVTGEVAPEDAAGVLGRLLDETGVFALISSDLSHYLDYETARARDERTAAAIEELRPEALAWDDACGRTAVQATLLVARRRGWACQRLDLRNSGDTAGGRRRVVGYGAFALGPAGT